MKRFWLFIANITGAEKHIRADERKSCGQEIVEGSYWYSDLDKYWILYPALKHIGERMKVNGSTYGRIVREHMDMLARNIRVGNLKQVNNDKPPTT